MPMPLGSDRPACHGKPPQIGAILPPGGRLSNQGKAAEAPRDERRARARLAAAWAQLVADVRVNGIVEPITMLGDAVPWWPSFNIPPATRSMAPQAPRQFPRYSSGFALT